MADSVLIEHEFWLKNLGDHARILFYAMAPNESGELERLQTFILSFDNLTAEIKSSGRPSAKLNEKTYKEAKLFYDYILELLALTLCGKFNIKFASSDINQMLNETGEYLDLFEGFKKRQVLLYYPIHYHLLWLPGESLNAAALMSCLDPLEKDALDQLSEYERLFNGLFIKAHGFNGFLRTKLSSFPALERLNIQTEKLISSFSDLIKEISGLCYDGRLLGPFAPLLAEHIIRESAYYLKKLSESVGNMK